jgi:hypothetical protein
MFYAPLFSGIADAKSRISQHFPVLILNSISSSLTWFAGKNTVDSFGCQFLFFQNNFQHFLRICKTEVACSPTTSSVRIAGISKQLPCSEKWRPVDVRNQVPKSYFYFCPIKLGFIGL